MQSRLYQAYTPLFEDLPTGHCKQLAEEFAPITGCIVPIEHHVQVSVLAATTLEYLPLVHGVQVLSAVATDIRENFPAAHWRQLATFAPPVERE